MDVPGDDMFVTQARSFKVVQLSVSTLPPVLFSCSQNEDKNLPLSIEWGQGTEPQASRPEGKFSKGACGQYSSFKIMCNLIARLVPLCVPHWVWIYWKLSLKAYRWRNKRSIHVGWLETKCWLIYIICCRVLMVLSADREYPGVFLSQSANNWLQDCKYFFTPIWRKQSLSQGLVFYFPIDLGRSWDNSGLWGTSQN